MIRPITLLGLLIGLAGIAACNGPNPNQLLGGAPMVAGAAPSLSYNTQHFQDPNIGLHGLTDPTEVAVQVQKVGSPEAVARLHGCTKITYAALGAMLTSWGVDLTSTDDGSAGELYAQGAGALGVAIYPGRVAEALIPSTAALAKQMDILVAAAMEMIANNATPSMPACPGVPLFDFAGNFSKEAISCVLGKPATDDHVTLANQVIAQSSDEATGQQLALSALLNAAQTCE